MQKKKNMNRKGPKKELVQLEEGRERIRKGFERNVSVKKGK